MCSSSYALFVDLDECLRVIRSFQEEGVDYVLIGGVAVNLHGIIRATESVDFFISPSASNIERLKKALKKLWNDPDIDTFSAEDFAGNYPTLRYGPPEGDMVVDFLARLGTKHRFEDLAFEDLSIGGETVRVATIEQLIKMKQDTLRPIDRADVEALKRRIREDS